MSDLICDVLPKQTEEKLCTDGSVDRDKLKEALKEQVLGGSGLTSRAGRQLTGREQQIENAIKEAGG
ncbi:MAG: hypothetical protein PHC51_03535 [bacterium]|nr:hypothetical protein [bacterium]